VSKQKAKQRLLKHATDARLAQARKAAGEVAGDVKTLMAQTFDHQLQPGQEAFLVVGDKKNVLDAQRLKNVFSLDGNSYTLVIVSNIPTEEHGQN
jgi:hypothetical protein